MSNNLIWYHWGALALFLADLLWISAASTCYQLCRSYQLHAALSCGSQVSPVEGKQIHTDSISRSSLFWLWMFFCLKTSLTTVFNVCWRVTKISYQVHTKLHQRVCPLSPIQLHDVYIYLILTSFDISLFFKTENGNRDVCSTAFPNVSIHFTTVSRCPAKVFSESKILYAPILIF